MKTPKRQAVYWRQLLLLATIWMVIHPSGATQVEQDAKILEPIDADLVSLDHFSIEQTMAPDQMPKVRSSTPRCAAWASCKGPIESQKMDRKQAALMAIVIGLSLKHRL